MRKITILIILFTFHIFAYGTQKVFLLHGIANSRVMMHKINKSFEKKNLDVENFGYRSLTINLDSLGELLYLHVKEQRLDSVSFVTFSMGGLVFRSMLKYAQKDSTFPVIYRVVMIAPPNRGAETADFYSSHKLLNSLLGPNVVLMRTDSNSYVQQLPVPKNTEYGLITCERGKTKGYNRYINGDNDGFISVPRTSLGVEKDQIFVKSHHATITRKKIARKLALGFIEQGSFNQKSIGRQ